MQTTPGELTYTSEGSEEVCGLYLIGMPDQIVEIEFLDFNVRCDTGGLLAVRKYAICSVTGQEKCAFKGIPYIP